MALVTNILRHHKPSEWDEHNYNNVRFVKIALDQHTAEYLQIQSEFIQKFGIGQKVVNIERVQHPFAYARFKIRKEHLAKLHGSQPSETRQFFPISDATAIDKILEYNCDYRRGGCSYSSYNCSIASSGGYVLVVKTFANFGFDVRDTHRYPEYLIQYGTRSCISSSSSLGLDDPLYRLRLY